ncbi:MAG: SEC-C domain-containing protein, partial [Acidobacteriia bacterium]|nr:SEC-C domain-containing protein [Terriglobia bacterium]
VSEMRAEVLDAMVARRVPEKAFHEQWELKELADDMRRVLNLDLPVEEWGREEGIDESHLRERIEQAADAMMAAKAANMGPELMRFIEKSLLIQVMDAVWKEHLYALDHLRQGIGLRAYGQRDPLNEYKSEAFALFNAMLDELKERVTGMLARVEIAADRPMEPIMQPRPVQMMELHPQPVPAFAGEPEMALEGVGGEASVSLATQPMRSDTVDPNDPTTWRNASRNAPCPCGSGRKYKHCHGRLG